MSYTAELSNLPSQLYFTHSETIDFDSAVDTRKSDYTAGPLDSEKAFNAFLIRNMVSSVEMATPSLLAPGFSLPLSSHRNFYFSLGLSLAWLQLERSRLPWPWWYAIAVWWYRRIQGKGRCVCTQNCRRVCK